MTDQPNKMATEIEENGSLVDDLMSSNESNITGRAAATPQGIALTYASLFIMALGPIILGSLRSVDYHGGLKVSLVNSYVYFVEFVIQKRGEEASDRIAMWDAATFPLYASGGLFGLYLFFKVSLCVLNCLIV